MSSELIDGIRDWHRKRNAAMEIRKRADLALGANLRTWLGWRKDLPEADRKRIAGYAAELIECGKKVAKGKPHPLAEFDGFKTFEQFILMAISSRAATDQYEDIATKAMEKLAEQLPVWEQFGEPIRGFGARSLAVIIGEAGDLSNYATHSKLWKRMGLAVMDGVRQGGLKKVATKETWILHGYSPVRRSRMWNVGDALVKGNQTGAYRTAYLQRKEYERNRAVFEGKTVVPSAKIPKGRTAEFMSDGHVHLRAQRYMEKKLLRDLWQAWRRAAEPMPEKARQRLPAALHSAAPNGAGEATPRVPAAASSPLPPRQSRKAAQAAGEAMSLMPEMAKSRVPPRTSRKAPAGAVAARESVPKGRSILAATKPSKAAQAAGRAKGGLPLKAKFAMPDHSSEDAL